MNKKVTVKFKPAYLVLLLGILLTLPYQQLSAQNRKGGGGGGGRGGAGGGAKAGGGGGGARPGGGGNASRSKPDAINKPGGNNGGANNRPGGNNASDRQNIGNNSGNKTNNIGSNNNKVNVDNSRKNVNVNIDNSKNVRVNNNRYTSVRRAPNYRPYARPPYRYGGYRYNCYHPYFFHPYHPFIWGPMWHPWGFFVVTLATTAIILSVDNNMPGDLDIALNTGSNNYAFGEQYALSGPAFVSGAGNVVVGMADQYYYDAGVYYIKGDGGYTVVAAPVGATIKTLPSGYETVSIDDNTKNYYYGGAFYEKTSKGYTVVPPTAGAVVEHVSDGGEDVKMGDVTYVKLGDTYYQPIKQDGKDMYEVADVEADK